MSLRVGKHTDTFLSELVANTEGKTDCKTWYTDDWGGYERVLPPEVMHIIGKENTQRVVLFCKGWRIIRCYRGSYSSRGCAALLSFSSVLYENALPPHF